MRTESLSFDVENFSKQVFDLTPLPLRKLNISSPPLHFEPYIVLTCLRSRSNKCGIILCHKLNIHYEVEYSNGIHFHLLQTTSSERRSGQLSGNLEGNITMPG